MTAGPVLLMLACAFTMAGAVMVYERLLAAARADVERAYQHADESQLLLNAILGDVDDARRRHPSARQYGGGNLRLISGGES